MNGRWRHAYRKQPASDVMSDCQFKPLSSLSSAPLLTLLYYYININQSIMENDRRFAVSKDNALANTIHSDGLRVAAYRGGRGGRHFDLGLGCVSFLFLGCMPHLAACHLRQPLVKAARALWELGGNANLALLTAQWVAINRPITDITCYRTAMSYPLWATRLPATRLPAIPLPLPCFGDLLSWNFIN